MYLLSSKVHIRKAELWFLHSGPVVLYNWERFCRIDKMLTLYKIYSTMFKVLKHQNKQSIIMILTFFTSLNDALHLYKVLSTKPASLTLTEWPQLFKNIYFILSGEINAYLKQMKMISSTSEMISYQSTSD